MTDAKGRINWLESGIPWSLTVNQTSISDHSET